MNTDYTLVNAFSNIYSVTVTCSECICSHCYWLEVCLLICLNEKLAFKKYIVVCYFCYMSIFSFCPILPKILVTWQSRKLYDLPCSIMPWKTQSSTSWTTILCKYFHYLDVVKKLIHANSIHYILINCSKNLKVCYIPCTGVKVCILSATFYLDWLLLFWLCITNTVLCYIAIWLV